MGVDELGHVVGRVGMRQPTGGLAHGLEAWWVGQQGVELPGQAAPVALLVGHQDGSPHVDQGRAFLVWWSRGAPGKGTRMAGTPATNSSATVMAPDRVTHTSAAP